MKDNEGLPENITRVERESPFQFSCHQGVKCFTECCRMLELALTPYDVLRLRKGTGKTSGELLEQVIIMEHEPGEPFPRFYLTMIDDGRASCVYVSDKGCRVYEHRPGACRAYPLGRASVRVEATAYEEYFVLLKEPHCLGFDEDKLQNPEQYMAEQELVIYNKYNDEVAEILQNEKIRKGFIPTERQVKNFILALYDIDTFREKLFNGDKELPALLDSDRIRLLDDEELLLYAIKWLKQELFGIF